MKNKRKIMTAFLLCAAMTSGTMVSGLPVYAADDAAQTGAKAVTAAAEEEVSTGTPAAEEEVFTETPAAGGAKAVITLAPSAANATATPSAASASATQGDCGLHAKWQISGDTLTISGTGNCYDVTVAWKTNKSAYSKVKSVVVQNGITGLPNSAFSSLTGLTKVSLPASLTEIPVNAFGGDTALTDVTIPSGVKKINYSAFSHCSALKNVKIPDSVTIVSNAAFEYCTSLESLTLPKTLTTLGASAFHGCSKLKTMTIPSGVTEIGYSTFADCKALKNFSVPSSVTKIDGSAFSGCTSLTSLFYTQSVKSIAQSAFSNCGKLSDVRYYGTKRQYAELKKHIEKDNDVLIERTKVVNNRPISEISTRFTDVSDAKAYYYLQVYWAVTNGVTAGTTKTTFNPGGVCTRGQMAAFLWRMNGEPEPTAAVNFADVPSTSYYYKAIQWLASSGITKGTDATHFSPNASCTRGQMAQFLWRMNGSPASGQELQFADLDRNTETYKAVQWLLEKRITKGKSDTAFAPKEGCTRAQMVTFLYNIDQNVDQ